MSKKRRTPPEPEPDLFYHGTDVSMSVIRRYARQIAERFQPDKIILFGSHAYGQPHQDSDVDLLVIMPAQNQHDQAVKIRWEIHAPFPMDLLVRTPKNLKWRLEEGESFHTEIVSKGKVLYEKEYQRMGEQGRSRSRRRQKVHLKRDSSGGVRSALGRPSEDGRPRPSRYSRSTDAAQEIAVRKPNRIISLA